MIVSIPIVISSKVCRAVGGVVKGGEKWQVFLKKAQEQGRALSHSSQAEPASLSGVESGAVFR